MTAAPGVSYRYWGRPHFPRYCKRIIREWIDFLGIPKQRWYPRAKAFIRQQVRRHSVIKMQWDRLETVIFDFEIV